MPLPVNVHVLYNLRMIVVLGIIAALALGGIIYLFLSKKSSKLQRLAALVALILSGVALGICGVILIYGETAAKVDPYANPFATANAKPVADTGFNQLILYLVMLVLVFGAIIFLGVRDQKRRDSAKTAENNKKSSDFSSEDF
ncbi:MAG: hypothetical protein FWF22_10950 [Treponema sp.]|nr:hypothetical protein [Treponema sp.]